MECGNCVREVNTWITVGLVVLQVTGDWYHRRSEISNKVLLWLLGKSRHIRSLKKTELQNYVPLLPIIYIKNNEYQLRMCWYYYCVSTF